MNNKHKGYDADFLGVRLELPTIDLKSCASLKKRGKEIKYTHFSVFQHKERRLPLLTVVNIKGEAYNAESRAGNEPWMLCADLDEKFQIDNAFYSNDSNTFDRGHMVRRVDPCWGPAAIANLAEKETFTWVNCTPQHKKLNQKGGAWFELEQHVMEQGVKNKTADITVFAGPVLSADDAPFIKQYRGSDVQVPLSFWKVIVWKKSNGRLYAVGFMMSQWEWIKDKVKKLPKPPKALREKLNDSYFETLKFKNNATFQVPITEIEKATGISFAWPHVSFPYKKKEPQKIVAVRRKNVYPVRTLRELEIIKLSGPSKALRALQKEAEKKTLSEQKVLAIVDSGQEALIRRYTLKNVTL